MTSDGSQTPTAPLSPSRGSNDLKAEHFVTVDNMLPVRSAGRAIYAGFGGRYTDSASNELWAALLEKAYVQWNKTGQTVQGNTRNEYRAISGGWLSVAYDQLYPAGYNRPTVIRDLATAER